MIDEGTSMATLRGLLDEFAHAMFGADKRTRFRPGYYPFTEPSVAFDVTCLICGGPGCPACKRTGWVTILGAGMVHPVVLENGVITDVLEKKTNVDAAATDALKRHPELLKSWLDGVTTASGGNGLEAVQTALGVK